MAETSELAIEEFDLYIDFEEGKGSPSRVFHSMAGLVDTLSQLDQILADIVSEASRTTIVLDAVVGGSMRSKLRSILEEIPDDSIKDGDWKKILGHFLVRGKHILLEWLRENPEITSVEQVRELQRELETEAERTGARRLSMYRPADAQALLSVVAEIDRSVSLLDPSDIVRYESPHGRVEIAHLQHVTDELVRELLTREVIDSHGERIVKVKKPDFLGRSQWLFMYSGHAINATVDAAAWLDSFQAGDIDLKPGDSLRVIMHERVYYGYNMEVVHVSYSVTDVIEILNNPKPEQPGFMF